jgi:ParB family chromosome partitioning protein
VEEGIRQTLDALAAPKALHEVLQPLVVEPGEEGRYSLQIGKRRLAASKIAGLDNVPAIILDGPLGAEESLAMRLVENIHREHALALLRLEPYSRSS